MAVAFGTPTQAVANATSITVNVPTHTDGDLLLLAVVTGHNNQSSTLDTPSGWTLVANTGFGAGGSAANRIYVWTRVASSEPASYNITRTAGTPSTLAATIIPVSGADDIEAFASGVNDFGNRGNTISGLPSVTTLSADAMALSLFGTSESDVSVASVTGSGTWTELVDRVSANAAQVHAWYKPMPTAGATGTYSASCGNYSHWSAVTLSIKEGAGGPTATAGAVDLGLSITGTARKTSTSSAGLDLGLSTSDDLAKTGETAATVPAAVAVDATALATHAAAAVLDLDLGLDSTSVKSGDVDATIAVALSLATSTTKAAAVAGALGIDLDMVGATAVDGHVTAEVGLALAAVATATKTATATASLGVGLGITGTATADQDISTGTLTLLLGITATASKTGATVGTLDLVVGLAGLARRLGWTLDPCRTLVVQPESRTLVVPAESRTLIVTC